MAEENIAFIGLGNMGYHMAGHIRKNMPSSAIFLINDVVASVCQRFFNEFNRYGPIKVVANAKEAASRAKIVISIVPSATNVRDVFLDPETGIIRAPKDTDRLLLECSTIDLKTTREVGAIMAEAGAGTYVDSPVSGGVKGAERGTLAFLVGHPLSGPLASRIRGITSLMSPPSKTILCGAIGTGLAAKIANNYIACTTMLITAEAFAIGERAGVDKRTLFECVRNSTGSSWVVENNPAVPDIVEGCPASNSFKPTFKPFMIVKDLSLGIEAARDVGINPNMAETAVKKFQECADDDSFKNLDCTAVWLKVNETQLPAHE